MLLSGPKKGCVVGTHGAKWARKGRVEESNQEESSWRNCCCLYIWYRTKRVDDQNLYLNKEPQRLAFKTPCISPSSLVPRPSLPSPTMASSDYLIYRPEEVGFFELLCLCLVRSRLSDCKFVESSHRKFVESSLSLGSKLEDESAIANWILGFTLIIQKILLRLDVPLRILGFIIEFSLNLLSLNGGFLRLVFRIITFSVVTPVQDSENYRSCVGLIDGRLDLYKTLWFLNYLPHMRTLNISNDVSFMDLTMLASKVAYENEAYVKKAVNLWKMHFVQFFKCWNEFEESGTYAYIFCDRSVDANLIVVSFRGTEPFDAKDWMADFELSWIKMGKMGRAHLGFMKAMGIQDERDYLKGWPKDYQGEKPLAYYSIRETLKILLQVHKNAKIVLTGHSLGGALAAIFPSILILHDEATILNRLACVLTYGQPRVGDETFGRFIEGWLLYSGLQQLYYRVVYRYDVVPRVPFDDPNSEFRHFGCCIYFSSWYKAQRMKEEPDKNFFYIEYLASKYFDACIDLIMSLLLSVTQGKDFKESGACFMFRITGLLNPGIGSHNPGDYLNAVRLGKITI
ncbi:Phospholipase A1-IIbeta [Cinnamomum micranthum f. kanehirae]|uniref:Phospholipase A1-IIbeta n=1 Tax=Cinnamomum micranthum f. kanehirae TaxID=337451 RepID=A0A443NEP6_9MAGN|nr:Phospholipase A1-IIbeta [Cinnamomum micranthum f. kanehirae]